MAPKRRKAEPHFHFSFWTKAGSTRTADQARLRDAIEGSGLSEPELRRRLGAAFKDLARALEGRSLDQWTAASIDWAISPREEPTPSHSGNHYLGSEEVK